MELCFILLKEENKLDELIKKLSENDFDNIMIFDADSHSEHRKNTEHSIFNSLKYMIDSFNDESRVILVLTETSNIEKVSTIVGEVTNKKEYLFFSFPVNNAEGFSH